MRFEVNCTKLHHCIMSKALNIELLHLSLVNKLEVVLHSVKRWSQWPEVHPGTGENDE